MAFAIIMISALWEQPLIYRALQRQLEILKEWVAMVSALLTIRRRRSFWIYVIRWVLS